MISWKYSFEEISKDLELAKKKKQALEDLLNAGKISESTYESLDKDISSTISEIEKRQNVLAEKMKSKLTELERQISTLEMFLANSEIQHVAGEIDDELHERESNAFGLGLDALKQQLDSIKGIVGDIMPEVVTPTPPSEPVETAEAEVPTTEEITEEQAEIPAEATIETLEETEAVSEEMTVEEPAETPTELPVESETVPEEVAIEEPTEAPTEEAAVAEAPVQEGVETLPEMPTEEPEEKFPSQEESVEEPEATTEMATEEEIAEAPAEEETEMQTEEAVEEASSEEEEEATEEEVAEW